VYRIDVETSNRTLMARLDMLALGCDMVSGNDGHVSPSGTPGSAS
jgi:hypothetical protein